MNKKIKRQSVKKSKPKKISKKKVGKGLNPINLEEDYKEILQFKQQGIELNTLVDLTFKDGRNVGVWIKNHREQLNKEQLDALGLKPVQKGKPIDKYMKLKEKYLKALSSATSSSEKALLMNNLKQVEKLIGRETRKKSIKRGSGKGEKTAWMINPLYKSVKQPRQYEEAYGTFEIGEIAPIISRRVVYKKGKTPQKSEKVELVKAMYTNPEVGERKVVKRKTFSKVY